MPEYWKDVNDCIRHLLVARYLLAKADDKALTHGEKHHLHEVIGMELLLACKACGYEPLASTQNLDEWEPLHSIKLE